MLNQLPARLVSKIQVTDADCWLWTGCTSRDGYGRVWDSEARQTEWAHRLTYRLLQGPLLPGKVLDHLCRTRNCVNPEHLELVDQRVNVQRGNSPEITQKRWRARDLCKHGHLLSGCNIRIYRGVRICRVCARERAAEDRKKRDVLVGSTPADTITLRATPATDPTDEPEEAAA